LHTLIPAFRATLSDTERLTLDLVQIGLIALILAALPSHAAPVKVTDVSVGCAPFLSHSAAFSRSMMMRFSSSLPSSGL